MVRAGRMYLTPTQNIVVALPKMPSMGFRVAGLDATAEAKYSRSDLFLTLARFCGASEGNRYMFGGGYKRYMPNGTLETVRVTSMNPLDLVEAVSPFDESCEHSA